MTPRAAVMFDRVVASPTWRAMKPNAMRVYCSLMARADIGVALIIPYGQFCAVAGTCTRRTRRALDQLAAAKLLYYSFDDAGGGSLVLTVTLKWISEPY